MIKQLLLVLMLLTAQVFATTTPNPDTRTINMAGLVVDCRTLSPLVGAHIYDADGKLLGKTDHSGYYHIQLIHKSAGAISFKLKIKKDGYKAFLQSERWGDLRGKIKNVVFYALQKENSKHKAFSLLSMENNDLSFEQVVQSFDSLKINRLKEDKIQSSKHGNDFAVVKVGSQLFLTSNSGWIELKSDKDLIAINHTKVVTVSDLNKRVKRSEIVKMSPVEPGQYKYDFYIETKEK